MLPSSQFHGLIIHKERYRRGHCDQRFRRRAAGRRDADFSHCTHAASHSLHRKGVMLEIVKRTHLCCGIVKQSSV